MDISEQDVWPGDKSWRHSREAGTKTAAPSFLDREVERGIVKKLLDSLAGMSPDDVEAVTMIHKREIGRGIFTELGRPFLTLFYRQIAAGEFARGYVVKKEGRVVGFIAGSSDSGAFFKKFFRRYWLQISWIAFKQIIRQPSFLPRLARRASVNRNKDRCAESLSGAVLKEYRTKGYGVVLLKRLLDDIRRTGVDRIQCDVVADENDPEAVALHRLYRKGGYRQIAEYRAGQVKYIRYMRHL